MTLPPLSSTWTFLSNHGHVLVCLARDPDARLRDIAAAVGITERAVQKILNDLEEAVIIARERHGRRNHYVIRRDASLRHPIEAHQSVDTLLRLILHGPPRALESAEAPGSSDASETALAGET